MSFLNCGTEYTGPSGGDGSLGTEFFLNLPPAGSCMGWAGYTCGAPRLGSHSIMQERGEQGRTYSFRVTWFSGIQFSLHPAGLFFVLNVFIESGRSSIEYINILAFPSRWQCLMDQ
jgi:hypothetical protein